MNLADVLLERETGSGATLRDGIVAAVSPLTVIVPPSTVASPAAALNSVNVRVGDFVQVLVQGANRLVIGAVGGQTGFVAHATRTSDVNGIVSSGAVTGLSVTFTAAANRRYKISASIYGGNQNGAGNADIRITEGGTAVQVSQMSRAAGATPSGFSLFVVRSPAAGSRTYAVTLGMTSTSFDVFAGATFPAQILVEDIGPAA